EVVLTNLPWQPVVDGETLPALPLERVARGASKGVDLMVGTNLDENRLFLVPGGIIDQITDEALAGIVTAYGLPVESTLAAYRQARPGESPGDLMAAIQTDWTWRIPSIRLADAHAKAKGATFMYEFAWPSPQFGGLLGAAHAVEMPFVFDTLGNQTEPLLGPSPPQHLADTMHRAWVNFATTGNPGWPRYETDHRSTMRFDTQSQVVHDPRAFERQLWGGLP
ncbi:MAG: carboxylesterase family protein, partial [Fimbriimonadaceae bacterium]|nr:carboxylesterase family protein [Fimbriimonadaceae bacterium]